MSFENKSYRGCPVLVTLYFFTELFLLILLRFCLPPRFSGMVLPFRQQIPTLHPSPRTQSSVIQNVALPPKRSEVGTSSQDLTCQLSNKFNIKQVKLYIFQKNYVCLQSYSIMTYVKENYSFNNDIVLLFRGHGTAK